MIFRSFLTVSSRNFAYLIGDERTREAAVVDPSGASKEIIEAIEDEGLRLKYVINTHSHSDHTAGNKELVSRTGAELLTYKLETGGSKLKDGATIRLGETKILIIHTPGHTPDGICLLVDNKLLTGDTLFVGECGRTDLPGGNPSDLYDSLFGKILKLSDELEIYPGHDYGLKPNSTLAFERKHNYVLQPRTKEEFIRFMKE